MVNVETNYSFLVALFILGMAIAYVVKHQLQHESARRLQQQPPPVPMGRIVSLSSVLFLSGLILWVLGWRLDPLLLLQQCLMVYVIGQLMFGEFAQHIPPHQDEDGPYLD